MSNLPDVPVAARPSTNTEAFVPATPTTRQMEQVVTIPGSVPGTTEQQIYNPVQARFNDSATTTSLLDPGKFEDNALNAYDRPAYHIRLLAANQIEVAKQSGERLLDGTAILASLEKVKTIVLAESGVTAGFQIKDLTIETFPPNTQARNRIAQDFTLTIYEPVSVSFLDALFEASQQLSTPDYRQQTYYIEITFAGYTESGSPVGMIPLTDAPKGKYVFPITMVDMNHSLDSSGASYSIKAKLAPSLPFYNVELMALRAAVEPKGNTVGEILADLAKGINEDWKTQYEEVEMLKMEFVFPEGEFNPSGFALTPTGWDVSPRRNNFKLNDNRIPQASFKKGDMIHGIVEEIISSTEKGQALAKDVQQQGEVDQSNGRVNERGFRRSVVYRVQPEVIPLDFNQKYQRYRLKVRYYITPHTTLRPLISAAQVENAQSVDVQRAMVQSIQNAGFLKKRYDYIHTGLNTEILNLDINYQINWYGELPNLMGARRDLNAVETHSRFNRRINAGNDYGSSSSSSASQVRQAQETVAPQPAGDQPSGSVVSQSSLSNGIAVPAGIDLEAGRVASQRYETLQFEARGLAARASSLTPSERARLSQLNDQIDRTSSRDIENLYYYRQISSQGSSSTQTSPALPRTYGSTTNTNESLVGRFSTTTESSTRPDVLPNGQSQLDRAPQRSQTSRVQYGEDIVRTTNKQTFPLRHTDGEWRVFSGGNPGPSHADKSIYGAILDQLYGGGNKAMQDVVLEIRGDPFWLGANGLTMSVVSYQTDEQRQTGRDSARSLMTGQPPQNGDARSTSANGVNSLINSDQHLLLTFRYPVGIDEATGQPIIRQNDIYSGIYVVIQATNIFADGAFRQTLNCVRLPLIDVAKLTISYIPQGTAATILQQRTQALSLPGRPVEGPGF